MRAFSKGTLIVFAFFFSATQLVFSQTNKVIESPKLPAGTKSFLMTTNEFTLLSKVIELPKLPAETKSFLMTADEFTLLSLDPKLDAKLKAKVAFRGHRILGSTPIVTEERTNLVNELENGIANADFVAMCFNPRHGIRAKKADQTIECLICFECAQVIIYSNSATNGYGTDGTPAKAFNDSLRIHKVPLAAH